MTVPGGSPLITLVLGGTRSGKSAVAEKLADEMAGGGAVTYVATATVYDEDMGRRVAAHRSRRPAHWDTVEIEGPNLPEVLSGLRGPVLVDSLGTWVASQEDLRIDRDALVEVLRSRPGGTVLVSEEVGLAVHPPTPVGRAFVDALGSLNQAVAASAARVVLVVAGRTLDL